MSEVRAFNLVAADALAAWQAGDFQASAAFFNEARANVEPSGYYVAQLPDGSLEMVDWDTLQTLGDPDRNGEALRMIEKRRNDARAVEAENAPAP